MTAAHALTRLHAHEMSGLLRRGEIGAVELLDAHTSLIGGQDRVLNAWVSLDPSGAQAAAVAADARLSAARAQGPDAVAALPALLGVPVLPRRLALVPGKLPKGEVLRGAYPPDGQVRARVALLAGCVQQVLEPEINLATIKVLQRNGVEVIVPRNQGCCGSLGMHTGEAGAARACGQIRRPDSEMIGERQEVGHTCAEREVAEHQGVEAYMVDNATYLKAEWLIGKKKIGVSAGASAPEVLVNEVIAELQQLGASNVQELQGVIESVVFQLPKNLMQAQKAQ